MINMSNMRILSFIQKYGKADKELGFVSFPGEFLNMLITAKQLDNKGMYINKLYVIELEKSNNTLDVICNNLKMNFQKPAFTMEFYNEGYIGVGVGDGNAYQNSMFRLNFPEGIDIEFDIGVSEIYNIAFTYKIKNNTIKVEANKSTLKNVEKYMLENFPIPHEDEE